MFRRSRLVLAGVALLASFAAGAADPNKVLRIVLPVRRNGLRSGPRLRHLLGDGQRGDLRAPADLRLPRAAGEARADARRGDARGDATTGAPTRSRSAQGHLLHARPGVQGPASASSSPTTSSTAFKRFVDPVNRSPCAFMLEGKIEGLDELGRAREEDRQVRLRRTRARASRRSTATRCASASTQTDYLSRTRSRTCSYGAMAREVVEEYGDDIMAHPVGTGAVPAEGMEARARRSCSRRIPTTAASRGISSRPSPPGTTPSSRQMKGKKMPQIGRVEISHHRGGAVALARVQRARSSTTSTCRPTFRDQAFDADEQAAAALGRARASRSSRADRSRHHVHVLQLPRSDGRRLLEGEDRAAPRDHHGATTRTRRSASLRKNLAVEDEMPIPAGVVGYDPGYARRPVRPGAREQAARPLRLQDRRRRLAHAARRQAAGAAHTRPSAAAIEREFNELWKKSMDAHRRAHASSTSRSSPTT